MTMIEATTAIEILKVDKAWEELRLAQQSFWVKLNLWISETAQLDGCYVTPEQFRAFKDTMEECMAELFYQNEVDLSGPATGDFTRVDGGYANELQVIDVDAGADGLYRTAGVYGLRWKILSALKYSYIDRQQAVKIVEAHRDLCGTIVPNTVSGSLLHMVEESITSGDGQMMKWIACIKVHHDACARHAAAMEDGV